MKANIRQFWFFPGACPCCMSDSYVIDLEIGAFTPLIAVCMSCGHPWHILRGTFAESRLKKDGRLRPIPEETPFRVL